MTRLEADDASKTFSLSVRELAEERRFYPIGFGRGDGWSGVCDGTGLHQRVLKARQGRFSSYRAEVFLQARLPVDGWTAIVSGRLDGCMEEEGGGFLIEEFKSALFVSNDFRPSTAAHERNLAQLMVYCHLWAATDCRLPIADCRVSSGFARADTTANSAPRDTRQRIRGSLVYVDAVSGNEAAFPLEYDSEACGREIQKRLRRRLAEWLAGEKVRRRKAEYAPSLPFPHADPRPGQRQLIDGVAEAVAGGENLLAEAPTGSGKTAAGLFPALRAGLASRLQVVFLTAKNLQQEMAVRALKAMNQQGVFRTAQIRSKERMCANGQVLCHEDFCPYARDYAAKMESSRVMDRLLKSHAHLDPDTVFTEARQAGVCPFEVQLELAARADALVADYNYVFEPAAALKHLAEEGLERAVLLVDEAHNLPDRAREIYSPSVAEERLALVYQYCLEQGTIGKAEGGRGSARNGTQVSSTAMASQDNSSHCSLFPDPSPKPRPSQNDGTFERLAMEVGQWLGLLGRLGRQVRRRRAGNRTGGRKSADSERRRG